MTRWRPSGPMADDDPRHGTVSGYRNLYCRCQPCRDANTAEHLARSAKPKPVPQHVHGTLNGYNYYGCRCDSCVQNRREFRRTAWHAKKGRAS